MLRNTSGKLISSVDAWARPKSEHQWKAGRSAMELAESWFRGGCCACPGELANLLDSHELTRGWRFVEGRPEFVTALPERGEGRNHDLWLRGSSAAGPLTVCIEAKVDEPFGSLIGEAVATARQRNPASGLPARVRALLEMLTGTAPDPEAEPWRDLRYQVLTALSGTALQAARDGSRIGVLVVQEFMSAAADSDLQRQNEADLKVFLREVFSAVPPSINGVLVGPKLLHRGAALASDVQLLAGKVQSIGTEPTRANVAP